ncbi:unnamed protein product [Camellia sinensis]
MVVYEVLIKKKHINGKGPQQINKKLFKIPKNNKNVTLNLTPIPVMMATSRSINGGMLSLLRSRTVKKGEIIVGLNSDNFSRTLLLRLLTLVVMPGDNVLAVHVMEPNDTFDPNTFHIHEDLCKSKQVDFQVKVCGGDSYITGLTHQVRINAAKILAIGCNSPCFVRQGTSQEEIKGSGRRFTSKELCYATNNFSPEMVIGEGGNSKVYLGRLDDGQLAAVKVLKNKCWNNLLIHRQRTFFVKSKL